MSPNDVVSLVRQWLSEERLFVKEQPDNRAHAHFLIKYPQGNQGHMFAVVVPKNRDLVAISSMTRVDMGQQKEMKKHMPDLNEIMQKIDIRIQQRKRFNDIWNLIEPVSIDYGLLEKSSSIYAVEADFKWNDLGSWSSIYNVSTKTKDKNVVRGTGVVLDGTNNLIESKKQFTALVGVSDMAVIATSDAILVVPKDKAEQVKDVVDYLEKNNKDELL